MVVLILQEVVKSLSECFFSLRMLGGRCCLKFSKILKFKLGKLPNDSADLS